MKITFNKKNLILFVLLFSTILPFSNILNFGIPIVYFFTPIGIIVIMCVLLGWIKIPYITRKIIVISILILLEIFLISLYSTVNKLGYFIFPTDTAQYIVRFIFLISAIVLAYKGAIDKDKFIKYFLIILNIGMMIGILQWIPWPGRQLLVKLYPFQDGVAQIEHLSRSLDSIRVHGFAQHATANGGIASFAFVFAYSIFKYFNKYKNSSVILMIISIVNIIASQARAGILSLVFAIVLFYLIDIKYEKKSLKSTVFFIAMTSIITSVLVYLYNVGNSFIVKNVYRWGVLIQTSGGERMTVQSKYFFSLMKGADYILGLSKPVINRSAISYGVEIEPINILVTYGILGFLLQYTLIVILLKYFYKKISKNIEDKATIALCVASFVGLFSYQVFSLGYFFFREIRIGLFPWILIGVSIGVYERYCGYKTSNR